MIVKALISSKCHLCHKRNKNSKPKWKYQYHFDVFFVNIEISLIISIPFWQFYLSLIIKFIMKIMFVLTKCSVPLSRSIIIFFIVTIQWHQLSCCKSKCIRTELSVICLIFFLFSPTLVVYKIYYSLQNKKKHLKTKVQNTHFCLSLF